jgi:hypothetical protein
MQMRETKAKPYANSDPLWRSKAKMRLTHRNDVMIFSGRGNVELAEGKEDSCRK